MDGSSHFIIIYKSINWVLGRQVDLMKFFLCGKNKLFRCNSKIGRRKPFILFFGALACVGMGLIFTTLSYKDSVFALPARDETKFFEHKYGSLLKSWVWVSWLDVFLRQNCHILSSICYILSLTNKCYKWAFVYLLFLGNLLSSHQKKCDIKNSDCTKTG